MADGDCGNIRAVQAVVEFYVAVRDGRVEDMLALLDPEVTCHPILRPGLSTYYGHGGMIDLASDMHLVHGKYHVDLDRVNMEDESKITVRATIFSEAASGKEPLTITTVFGFRDGLIFSIESQTPGV